MRDYLPSSKEYAYYKNCFNTLMPEYAQYTSILEHGYQIKPFERARIDTGIIINNGKEEKVVKEDGITISDMDTKKAIVIPKYLYSEFFVKLMENYFESKDIYETLYLCGERNCISYFKKALKKFTGSSEPFYQVKPLWWKLDCLSPVNLEDKLFGLEDYDYYNLERYACDVYANIFFSNHELTYLNHLCITWYDVVNHVRSLMTHKNVYLDPLKCTACKKEGGEYVHYTIIAEGCTFGSLTNNQYFQVDVYFIPALTIFFCSYLEPYKNIVNFYKMVHQILSDLDAKLLARSIRETLNIDVNPDDLYDWVGLTRDTIDVSRKVYYSGCV